MWQLYALTTKCLMVSDPRTVSVTVAVAYRRAWMLLFQNLEAPLLGTLSPIAETNEEGTETVILPSCNLSTMTACCHRINLSWCSPLLTQTTRCRLPVVINHYHVHSSWLPPLHQHISLNTRDLEHRYERLPKPELCIYSIGRRSYYRRKLNFVNNMLFLRIFPIYKNEFWRRKWYLLFTFGTT